MARPITFLSDYGYDDEFAGVCRAVIARIAPEATVIDLTHGIPRHAIRQGAAILAHALPFAPPGVHLAVVDPGVGTPRRALAVRVGRGGPDARWARQRAPLAGDRAPRRGRSRRSTCRCRRSGWSRSRRLSTAATSSPRSPPTWRWGVAGRGRRRCPRRRADHARGERAGNREGRIVAHVPPRPFRERGLDLGERGSRQTGLRIGRRLVVEAGGRSADAVFTLTFADVGAGELLLYVDSYGSMALAVNRGSAAAELGLAAGRRGRPAPSRLIA